MTTAPRSDLKSLMTFIGERYTFTSESYPGFDELSIRDKFVFTVRHSALHMMKSTAKIAAEAEKADHGGLMDPDELRTAVTKMLVNTLKLAEELGMRPHDLAANVPKVMASK